MTVSTLYSQPESPVESCFVIGPIGDKLAPFGSEGRLQYEQSISVWDYVIQPASHALGIDSVRADMIAEPGEITEQVFQRLRDDELVIADVTGGNANVMYELGLRHTRNQLTIQIGEKERLPFDVTTIRTIQFNRTESGLIEARERLQEAITAGIERGPQPVTATRIFSGLSAPTLTVLERTEPEEENKELRSEQEDEGPGFLDMIAEAEEAVPLLANVSEELSAVFQELPALTDEMLEEMAKSDARSAGAAGRLVIAQRLADRLEEPTARIEQLAADFIGELERMDPGISYLISRLEEEPSIGGQDEEAETFVKGISELAQTAEASLGQVGTLADNVESLGQISNRLRPVARRMATAIRKIAKSSHTMQGWGRRLDSIE